MNSTVDLSSDLNCASNLSSLWLSSTSRSLADLRLFARERPSRGFVVGGRVKCVGTRQRKHGAMLTLFGNVDSGNVHKVQMILSRLGVPFRRVDVRQDRGQPRDARFLAINPMGKVPAVRLSDGDILSDSGAILFYFSSGTPLWPDVRRDPSSYDAGRQRCLSAAPNSSSWRGCGSLSALQPARDYLGGAKRRAARRRRGLRMTARRCSALHDRVFG